MRSVCEIDILVMLIAVLYGYASLTTCSCYANKSLRSISNFWQSTGVYICWDRAGTDGALRAKFSVLRAKFGTELGTNRETASGERI